MKKDRFVSFEEGRNRVSFSRTHLYRLIKQNKFPHPVPLGPHKVAFLESEIDAWIKSRIKAREREEGLSKRKKLAREAVRSRFQKRDMS